VKRSLFIVILLIITAIIMASCPSTPKTQTENRPVEEVADSAPPQPEPEPLQESPIEEGISEIPEEEPDILADAEKEADIEEAPLEDERPMLVEAEPEIAPEPIIAPELPPPPPPPVVAVSPPPPPPPAPPPPPEPPRITPPPAPVAPPPPAPPPVERPPLVVQEPTLPEIPELPNPTPAVTGLQEEEMVFSRTVRATLGQLVVIPFRGTGWVYLGESGAQRGIVYDSRRLDPEGQNFVFRTEAPGEYALKFYRQDFIRDFILNDYVKVIVGPPPETAGTGWFNPSVDRGRVVAEPRWPTSLAEAQSLRADSPSRSNVPTPSESVNPASLQPPPEPTTPAAPVQPPAGPTTPTAPVNPANPPSAPLQPTASPTQPTLTPPSPPTTPTQPATTAPIDPAVDPESFLEKAKEEFGAGRVASAISALDQLRVYYPIESDEVLWLYGQFYEANSPSRNILTSLEYYRRLLQEYPQSSRYDDARRRVAYLQRYYINIH
jgi:hypothetical protein